MNVLLEDIDKEQAFIGNIIKKGENNIDRSIINLSGNGNIRNKKGVNE